jgi:hypothetical protein
MQFSGTTAAKSLPGKEQRFACRGRRKNRKTHSSSRHRRCVKEIEQSTNVGTDAARIGAQQQRKPATQWARCVG